MNGDRLDTLLSQRQRLNHQDAKTPRRSCFLIRHSRESGHPAWVPAPELGEGRGNDAEEAGSLLPCSLCLGASMVRFFCGLRRAPDLLRQLDDVAELRILLVLAEEIAAGVAGKAALRRQA